MSIPTHGPLIFLRCNKCARKTDHVLIHNTAISEGEIEENYECQECGETKKIYEFATARVQKLMYYSVVKGLQETEKQGPFEVVIRKKRRGL
jgi:NAD-dependent SIR2 family protein deacetylase